jgi:pimeloyl-ACP methyl ester carboxylesterase
VKLPILSCVLCLAALGCGGSINDSPAAPGPAGDGGPADASGQDASPEGTAGAGGGNDAVAETSPEAASEGAPDAAPDAMDQAVPDSSPPLVWALCDTSEWPDGYPSPPAGVECTSTEVPLDHAKPGGTKLVLNVARHKAKSHPTGKAMFFLAGGPGGSSVVQSGVVPHYLPGLRDDFDWVYVDQRGTGMSGYFDCASEYGGKDLNHWLSLDAAHDIDLVRARLGYDKIYFRGGSYGTRLGLEVLRQHGDRVVAAVLDGMAPPPFDLFGDSVRNFDRGVKLVVDDCNASAQCLAVSPTLLADLTARRAKLKANPRPILVSGMSYYEDESLYLSFLQAALMYAQYRYQVPRAIHAAIGGDNVLWNKILSDLSGYDISDPPGDGGLQAKSALLRLRPRRPWLGQDYVAPALFLTVSCAEFLPNAQGGVSGLFALAGQQTWGNDIGEYSTPAMAEACAAWKVAPIAPVLLAPVQSQVRTLLFSGFLDLQTVPEWGDQALKSLPNGTHVVIPYATHSTLSVPCAAQILTDFVKADGEMTKVDTSCVAKLKPPAW